MVYNKIDDPEDVKIYEVIVFSQPWTKTMEVSSIKEK